MRLYEILTEGADIRSTIMSITDEIGTPIADLYERLSHAMKRAADMNGLDSHGRIVGQGLIIGGEGSRWAENHYIPKLEKELYALAKQTKAAEPLRQYLVNNTKKNFTNLATNLPPILMGIAKKINAKSLYDNAEQWQKMRIEFEQYVTELAQDADEYGETGYDDSAPRPEKGPNPIAGQNVAAETIINDVLNKPEVRRHAGEIRNILARSDNKLATLQQELSRRGIRL